MIFALTQPWMFEVIISRLLEIFVTFQKQPPDVFYKNDVLKNFVIFTEKHLCCRPSGYFEKQLRTADSDFNYHQAILSIKYSTLFRTSD